MHLGKWLALARQRCLPLVAVLQYIPLVNHLVRRIEHGGYVRRRVGRRDEEEVNELSRYYHIMQEERERIRQSNSHDPPIATHVRTKAHTSLNDRPCCGCMISLY